MAKFPENYDENTAPAIGDWLLMATSALKSMKIKLNTIQLYLQSFFVINSRKVNNKLLNTDISLSYTDVHATRAGYDSVIRDDTYLLPQAYAEDGGYIAAQTVVAFNGFNLFIGFCNNCTITDFIGDTDEFSGISFSFRTTDNIDKSIRIGSVAPLAYLLADNANIKVQDESSNNIQVNS